MRITLLEICGNCGKDGLIPALHSLVVNPNCFYWFECPRVYFCDAKCSLEWHQSNDKI